MWCPSRLFRRLLLLMVVVEEQCLKRFLLPSPNAAVIELSLSLFPPVPATGCVEVPQRAFSLYRTFRVGQLFKKRKEDSWNQTKFILMTEESVFFSNHFFAWGTNKSHSGLEVSALSMFDVRIWAKNNLNSDEFSIGNRFGVGGTPKSIAHVKIINIRVKKYVFELESLYILETSLGEREREDNEHPPVHT